MFRKTAQHYNDEMIRVCLQLKSWIIAGSTGLMNRPVFGHVNVNPCSLQCNAAIRLRRFTAENNIVPQLSKATTVQDSGHISSRSTLPSNVSLADISKPVPFNTHQLVCRLQSKGTSN